MYVQKVYWGKVKHRINMKRFRRILDQQEEEAGQTAAAAESRSREKSLFTDEMMSLKTFAKVNELIAS